MTTHRRKTEVLPDTCPACNAEIEWRPGYRRDDGLYFTFECKDCGEYRGRWVTKWEELKWRDQDP